MDAAVRAAAGLAPAPPAKKAKVTPLKADGEGRVVVHVEGDDAEALRGAVAAAGGEVSDADLKRVRAAVPPNALQRLAGSSGVSEVRRPETPVELEVVSEGVSQSSALAWHTGGRLGAGVKVGILDVGFGRLDEAQAGGEVPANTVVRNGLCPAENASSHGTTVAEVVHDMAPQAQLFLACVTDSMDFDDAARWLEDQGVSVVNVSMAFPGTGRGNGAADTNQTDWTPATTVAYLRESGVVVVAAAGNEADKHMTGAAADPENNGWMNISGASENQGFTIGAGATVTVSLQWDAWLRTNHDLDVFVMDQLGKPTGLNDPHLGGRYSVRPQKETAGGLSPVETVTFTNTESVAQTYWIYVQRKDGAATHLRYDLTIYGNASGVAYVQPGGSVAEPATSPYAIAVGAIAPANAASGAVESYSSRGPTIDGRIKPDVTGFTRVSTLTGGIAPGATRSGTSIAAAHVTGAAALYKGANPGLDPAELEALLLDSSSRPGRDNDFGHGVLNLGSPRVPQPPGGSAFTPLPTTRRLLDTNLGIGGRPANSPLQPGETFTLRIADLPPDATAVMIDVTTMTPAGSTELEVFADTPTGTPTMHAVAGQYSSAFITATLHPQDKVIRIKNVTSAVNVIVDLFGYYSEQSSASTFVPKSLPHRLLDTRTWGAASPKLDQNEVQTIKVRDVGGVPANATAVLVNVTVMEASAGTHLELYAQTLRNKWTMTAYPGEVSQTLTLVPVADDGSIRIQNYTGSVHAVVDLVGWYATGASGARYVPLRHVLPAFDSRTGTQTGAHPFGTSEARSLTMRRLPRVPYDASAAMLGVRLSPEIGTTATSVGLWCQECGWRGHTNVSGRYAFSGSPPAYRPISYHNAAVVPLDASGWAGVRNDRGSVHLSAALSGYFVGGQKSSDTPPPAPTGYWAFDEGAGTTVADSSGNGRTATLNGAASWVGGRPGTSAWFDGTTAYASTSGPVMRTDQSFTVAAWVYLDRNDTWRTVIGQDGGTNASPFVLQYSKSLNKWAFNTTVSDITGPQEKWAAASTPARLGEWTHLAAVYDAPAREIRLYVNGARDGVTTGVTIWRADGPFMIGRAKYNRAYVQHFPGAIDEVRAYDRVLVDSEVRELHRTTPPYLLDHYRFDEGTGTTAMDSSWRANHGTLYGGATWTAGAMGQAAQFNGTSAYAGTAHRGVVTMDSFTVAAWVRPDRVDGWRTAVSQDGAAGSGFYLQYSAADGCWAIGVLASDAAGATATRAIAGAPPAVGVWTHLAAVYDAGPRQLRLYVNGNLVGLVEAVKTWDARGGLVIGRARHGGQPADYFAGAVDEVRTYQGVLPEPDIRALARR